VRNTDSAQLQMNTGTAEMGAFKRGRKVTFSAMGILRPWSEKCCFTY